MRMRFCVSAPLAAVALSIFGGVFLAVEAEAVTLSVTPNTVSNTYTGPITLQITGLTNGEPVLIQRFFDANSNNVPDPGENLEQSFKITDGQFTSFGGVRDINIPGDDDGATNGQIQTSINLSTSPELSRLAGGHLVVVSSPGGHFAPVIQSLTVTQSAFAQRIIGQVTSSSLPVPGAGVALLVQSGNNMTFVLGTTADASGNFSVNCAPGSYVVLGTANGYVFDAGAGPPATVGSGQVVTQNVSLIAATCTISGRVTDAATSNGIPSVQFFLGSTANKIALCFTDTNGNFSVPVVADQWKVETSDFSANGGGWLRPQNKPQADTTTNSVTGLNIQYTKETALVYGQLRNDTNAPLPGIAIDGSDIGNLFTGRSTTDTNGYYVRGVKGGSWYIAPDNTDPGLTNYFVQGTNVNVLDGQAVQANFTAGRVAAHLRGVIQDDHGTPIPNITLVVQPFPLTNNGGGSIYPTTDGSGNFDAPVTVGAWSIALECVSAQSRNYVNVDNYSYTVVNGVDQNGLIVVFPAATAAITGTVKDAFGNPVAGVTLNASSGVYDPGCINTDSGGHYQINVINGTWNVSVPNFELNSLGYAATTNQSVLISGGNQTANFVVQPLPPALSQPKLLSGQFQFTLTGYDARSYRIEASTNCATWTSLGTNQTAGGTLSFADPNTPSFKRRFYRAVVVH